MSNKTELKASHRLLQQWIDAEHRYQAELHDGKGPSGSVKITGEPSAQVLFTAPHSVNHRRNGGLKYADLWTGGLAETLAFASKNCALTAEGPLNEDPNWDESLGTFKRTLITLLHPGQFVIDLHGMRDAYGIDINLGLGRFPSDKSKSVVDHFRDSFTRFGLKVSINWPFDAARSSTVTSFVQGHGVNALQMEIAAKLRRPVEQPLLATVLLDGVLSASSSLL